LQRENVFHEVQGSEIVVAGNDAQRFAEVFHVETGGPCKRRPQSHEPHSLAVVRGLSPTDRQSPSGRQKIFFSIPSPGAEGEAGSLFTSLIARS